MKWKLLPLILLLSVLATAQTITTTYRLSATTPTTGTLANGGEARETNSTTQFRQIVWHGTGTISTCSVRVDSSADGTVWTVGGAIAAQACTTNGSSAVASGVFNFTRINITTLTGGGTLTVTYSGFPTNPGGGGGGTVTDVTASTPLQSSGGNTPNISFLNQTANTVLAGPAAGGAAAPTFRALVAADLPASFTVPFSSITTGTNTIALLMGTGGTLLTSGTGQIRGTGLSIISTGVTAPSPLATSVCPSGQPVFKYLQNVSGDFQDVGSIDLTTGLPTTPTPAAPRGTEVHCWREWYDDSGVAGTAIRNNLVGIEHTMGHGGVANGAALDERAISSRITNADASFQQIHQMIANYNEAQLTLTPHFNGHAGLEDDVSSLRASTGDSRAGNDGSNPSSITGTSSSVSRLTSTASMGGGGVWAAYVAEVTDTGGGSPGASVSFMGLNIKGFINSGGMTTGQWVGINIAAPNVAAPSFSEGLNIANYGTCSVCYDMTLGGVNSAGTPAGWSSATGPFTFGQQAHAASGYQTDTLGGVKIKASASAGNMLGLFGFTSGSALIGVADAAGTPNRINLPTATGSANGILQTDGASPQQTSWTLTPSLSTLSLSGQFTSTLATGTAPLVIASTTNVANLNASSLAGATFAAPGAIGGGAPGSGAFTTLSVTGQITSTLATGTAPLVVASTTNVANLNASSLSGATFAAPGPIGSGTPSTGAFTTLSSTGVLSNSLNGAASTASVSVTGTPFTGGTGTTTFPLFYLNSGVTAPTSFSTSGTVLGINAPSGFVGRFLDFRVNGGTQAFSVGSTGGITTNSDFTFSSGASKLTWSGRSVIQTPSDGVLEITNNAGTDFTRLQFGGTTSSFPSIKRNSTALNFRLADDSADAPITAGSTTIGGGTPILKVLSATATLDFGNLAAIGCEDLTITVTGAALGDTVAIGVPNGSVPSATFWYSGWVSAANTVTIRGCTLVSGDPASGTFRATVTQF